MNPRKFTGHSSVVSVSDDDLQSYVDGGLDTARRAVIEGFLACNPDLAARVMQQMHQRRRSMPSSSMAQGNVRAMRRAGVALACLACVVAGWMSAEGMDNDGPFRDLSATPRYVDDAIMSQRVAHVRIGMESQIETPVLNSAEIEQATQIRMPDFPGDWRMLDAQVYPSEEGLSVSVLMEPEPGRKYSLFAVLADTSATEIPTVAMEKGEYAAYWESNGAAYVLTGDASRDEILSRARMLSGTSLM